MNEQTELEIQKVKTNKSGSLRLTLETCQIIADWNNNNPDVKAAGGLNKFCLAQLGFQRSKTARHRQVGYWLVNQIGVDAIIKFGITDFEKIYLASLDAEDGMLPKDALKKWVNMSRPKKVKEATPFEKAFADRHVKKDFENGLVSMKSRGWTEAQTTERLASLMFEAPDQLKAVFEAMEGGS